MSIWKFSRNTQYSSSGQAEGSPVKVLNEKLDSLQRDRNGTVTEPEEKGLKDIPLCTPSFCWGFPCKDRTSPVCGQMLPQKAKLWQAESCMQPCPQLLLTCHPADIQRGRKVTARARWWLSLQTQGWKALFLQEHNTYFFAPAQKRAGQNSFWNKYFPEVKCTSKSLGVAFQNLMWMAEPSYCWPVQRQKKKRDKYGIQQC